ncbi:Hypothetical protein DEACI_2138 [Acididesulfobacillus acetoxydans]|uniref:Uncharacterized protein n=2 Tax=Acididesulfobacillus acetoxydans TaxID=1561005 RepID=A0A8S0WYG2_9FIRM|nr:hypothetical protein [Acididesulfobacillus acetoxydans]CAA7601471.1 Hypothetical protein DEACI_2138 [Acididesulfobacillus acetoxydans]CEJ06126.1 Hypothetical protein DEACI_0572 [Acididesulfobacillus acetoxydans]
MFDILREFLYNTIGEFVVNKVVNQSFIWINCRLNRLFDHQTQLKIHLESQAKLFIRQGLLSGAFQPLWSYILEFEVVRSEGMKEPFGYTKWQENLFKDMGVRKLSEKAMDSIMTG